MRLLRAFRAPLDDYLAALEACLTGTDRHFVWIAALSLMVTWWLYVPIHELLHAYGCIWTGGSVNRLEIDAVYGAAYLQRFFPFVEVGSDYAGQLTGFDTRGSDLVYLATDALPFSLTIFPGVALLRSAARSSSHWAAVKLGAAVPLAYAPFLSITGDYFEMGSILVTRVLRGLDPSTDVGRWRSDDLIKRAGEIFGASDWTNLDLLVMTSAALLGTGLAFATYLLGAAVANIWSAPLGGALD